MLYLSRFSDFALGSVAFLPPTTASSDVGLHRHCCVSLHSPCRIRTARIYLDIHMPAKFPKWMTDWQRNLTALRLSRCPRDFYSAPRLHVIFVELYASLCDKVIYRMPNDGSLVSPECHYPWETLARRSPFGPETEAPKTIVEVSSNPFTIAHSSVFNSRGT